MSNDKKSRLQKGINKPAQDRDNIRQRPPTQKRQNNIQESSTQEIMRSRPAPRRGDNDRSGDEN